MTHWGDRLFPDFQILFRRSGRVIYINLTASRQATALTIGLVALLLFGYLGFHVQQFGTVVLSRNRTLVQADRDVAGLRQQIEALRDTLAEAESRAETVGEDNDRLKAALTGAEQRIASLQTERDLAVTDAHQQFKALDAAHAKALADAKQRIDALDAERTQLEADRAEIQRKLATAQQKDQELQRHSDSNQVAMEARIQSLEQDLAQANLGAGRYRSDLARIDKRLIAVAFERQRLLARQHQGLDDAAPSAVRDTELVAADKSATDNTPPAGLRGGAGKIEALIAATGLDITRLLRDAGDARGAEGGPFVPLGAAIGAGSDARRHKLLERLAAILPLRAPLDHYRVESPFGPRRDPFNHRRGFHTGLDLSAPYRTHVFSTAPGTVIEAGAEGQWGRLVEIDDGHGIVTRYAHLHRVLVVRGQKVPAHYAIGELGSTGRSTGPHVHYEVVIDGTAVDPAKFLGAGDNVMRVGETQ